MDSRAWLVFMFVPCLRYTVAHMIKITTLCTCLLSCLLAWQPVFSEFSSGIPDSDSDLGDFIPGEKWREGEFSLPAYPDEDKLVPVELDRGDSRFNYYLDPESLSVGKDDVVRYTVVITSGSGASNVLYEGLRCSRREYRTYAYGTLDKTFTKARVSEWKLFYDGDRMKHRYSFYRDSMCSKVHEPNKPDVIMQRIRYPSNFTNSGE